MREEPEGAMEPNIINFPPKHTSPHNRNVDIASDGFIQ